MLETNPFDLLASPLKGTNLIEASAGTGKTYTITCLYLRLVLEEGLSPDQILAVTFTEAATLELKDRIRKKLGEAIRAFREGGSDDTFLAGLVKKTPDAVEAGYLLKGVVRDFDEAAVYTIHGFCRRVLYENAFESGSLFDTELIPDEGEVMREVVEDFWRRNFYEAPSLFVSYVLEQGVSPASLVSLAAGNSGRPHMKIIPRPDGADPRPQEKVFRDCFGRLRSSWERSRGEVREVLNSESLNRAQYKIDKIPSWISAMDRFMGSGGKSVGLFPGFEKFTAGSIEKAVKKKETVPSVPFFDLCEEFMRARGELVRIYDINLLGIKAALFPYVRDELEKRKTERNMQSFNDLLIQVQRALDEKGGEELARSVRERFRAVLIDEFQDTDPVQYAIFGKVFGNRTTPFFLIGDPKQAIYGFRGADIFTYMEAARKIGSRYTLLENWRSGKGLVSAVNAVFTSSENPFAYEEIRFYPGTAVEKKNLEPLLINGRSSSAFQLWFLDAERFTRSDKAVTKGDAKRHIRKAVATEISRLVDMGRKGEAVLGERPLREGDLAVLVRTNMEARDMQKALSDYNIPSVLYSTGSLFESHEAMEMERVLTGIGEPNNESLVRAALSTDLMGIKGETLEALMEDEPGWDALAGRIRAYHRMWNERGFMRMFRDLLDREDVLQRLMSLPDGERRNTNLLHLLEVLHKAETEQRLGLKGLIKWLAERMDAADEKTEEYQLRLETDENAVQIATIHKSKGLEYPVVFCPFGWDGSKIRKTAGPVTFHAESEGMRLILDLGSEEIDLNRRLAQREELSENLRLLYVALTRAQARCYMVWGRIRGSGTSAQAYLFHTKGAKTEADGLPDLDRLCDDRDDEEMKADLKELAERSQGEIELSPLPIKKGVMGRPADIRAGRLSRREFAGRVDDGWKISSFSSLASGTPFPFEQADRDALPAEDVEEGYESLEEDKTEDKKGIFSFPKGAHAGTFFHDLLEHLDFTGATSPGLREMTVQKLEAYGFESDWLDSVCQAVKRLLNTPLSGEDKDLRFSKIGRDSRLNELEFYFPIKRTTPKDLERIFETHAAREGLRDVPETMGRLSFRPSKGFMRGFIDMVFEWRKRFYIVDWKSNFLGKSVEEYGQDSLRRAMKDHYYVLQYHIYAMALDQYLRLRLPDYRYEDSFGGVFYVFLRGVDPEMGPDYGIFRDVPSPELMRALRASLIDMPVEV